MVFIESKKYACETCIKGHRSSACKHTDRPLFEIKKKGRPVTQCEHCRELRKTKQVHVKCICEIKNDPSNMYKKVGAKAPESAAFPNGLPEALALEASVGSLDPRTTASDPSLPSGVAHPCSCMTGVCHCWTPRKSAPRPRRKTDSALTANLKPLVTAPTSPTAASPGSDAHTLQTEYPPSAASHILARISELRPVLPRPSAHHEPSSGIAHGHGNRHHHESAFFSPYGRAYDINHIHVPPVADDVPSYGAPPQKPQTYDRAIAKSIPIAQTNGSTSSSEHTPVTFPSSCTCGDGCRCPGCYHHNGAAPAASPSAYATCVNPGTCNTCLDCTILSLPPDTALSIPEPLQAEAIDEWIRQVQANPDSTITASNGNDSNGNVIDDGRFAGWDSLAQLATGRTQCVSCNSFFCTCGKEADDDDRQRREVTNEDPACCDKPKVPSVDMGQGNYESSDFLDYSMLGINDVYLDSAMDVFRSRSPSSSPNSNPDSFSQILSTPFAYPALVEKMSPSQQSMYINGRGFYSDPYLSMSSNERSVDNFGVLDTPTPFMPMQVSNLDYPVENYAISNPDSDSSYDSVDDFGSLPSSQQASDKAPRMSVSPVPLEGMRTLYQ